MRKLSETKDRITLLKQIRLFSLVALIALGSYVTLIPVSAYAADCNNTPQAADTAETTITVTNEATYRAWARLASSSAEGNSLLITIDGQQCTKLGDTPLTPQNWTWVGHKDGSPSTPALVSLSAGQHTVKLVGDDAGVKINGLLFLADTACTPSDNGDNCTTTPGVDTVAPTAPTDVRGVVTSNKSISLTWSASQDSSGVTGYDIYRSPSLTTATKVGSVTETLFHDANLTGATTYSYYVVAHDGFGNTSTPSNTISVKTLAQSLAGKGKLYGQAKFSSSDAQAVTVSFAVNGIIRSYTSDTRGYYFITDIPAGTYIVKYQAGNSVKYVDIKIKSSGDTIKDLVLPKAPVQPPIVSPKPFTTVSLDTATLSGQATFITEVDGTKSILFTPTSTPDPDPNPNPGQTGCIVNPNACGYPDSTNTGYRPTGVTLPDTSVPLNSDGDYVITEPGAVIDSKRINGCVIVKAPNVTIKRSLITNCLSYFNIRLYPEGGNFTLEDTEIDGNNVDGQNAAIVDDGHGPVTIRRMYMHNVADGPHPGENWLIEDSYITDLYACSICHNDTIQSAGALNVTLRHNTIVNTPEDHPSGEGGKNAVVRIATEQGPVNGFVIENNLLSGGNFAVQVREQGSGYPQGVKVLGNRIVPNWRFAPYDVGPVEDYIMGTVQFSGNYRDDTAQTLNL